MPVNSVAENVLGTIGTICWSGQIIPQIWKSWRTKDTEGLSHWLMLIWGIAAVFLGVYSVAQNLNIPLIIQPQLFGLLSIIAWSQCLYYNHNVSLKRTITILLGTLLFLGGFEAGMVFAIRPATRSGNNGPLLFFGIMTSVIIAGGLLPQYYEIYRFGEVKGISMLFMSVDALGGVFSLLSLVFKEKMDVLAAVAYSLVVVMDGIVIILALILNPLADKRRQRQEDIESDIHVPTERTIAYHQHEPEDFATLDLETRVPSRAPSREKEDNRPDDDSPKPEGSVIQTM